MSENGHDEVVGNLLQEDLKLQCIVHVIGGLLGIGSDSFRRSEILNVARHFRHIESGENYKKYFTILTIFATYQNCRWQR
jgi:hypothetical protein